MSASVSSGVPNTKKQIKALEVCGTHDARGSYLARDVPLASQSPYPIIVYSVANYKVHLNNF